MQVTEILTRNEVCKWLRLSRTYLDHLGHRGPPFFRVGRAIRYFRVDVLTWLADENRISI